MMLRRLKEEDYEGRMVVYTVLGTSAHVTGIELILWAGHGDNK